MLAPSVSVRRAEEIRQFYQLRAINELHYKRASYNHTRAALRSSPRMLTKFTTRSILIVFLILAVYLGALLRGFTERSRRSLDLHDETIAADRVFVSAIITNVNPATQEMTDQLGFRPMGSLSQDSVTASADLKLLVNKISGQQEFDFAKGKRMNRIETA
jgi:hypothetical protein